MSRKSPPGFSTRCASASADSGAVAAEVIHGVCAHDGVKGTVGKRELQHVCRLDGGPSVDAGRFQIGQQSILRPLARAEVLRERCAEQVGGDERGLRAVR